MAVAGPCSFPWISPRASALAPRQAAAERCSASCDCCSRAPLYKSFGTPCSSPGTPSGKTGLRSPGSRFLVSRKSSRSVGSNPLVCSRSRPARRTARLRRQQRSNVANGAWWMSGSTQVFPNVNFWQPAEVATAAIQRATAGWRGSHRRWQSYRATAASLRNRRHAMPRAPAIRARYGDRFHPAPPRPEGAAACRDRQRYRRASSRLAPWQDLLGGTEAAVSGDVVVHFSSGLRIARRRFRGGAHAAPECDSLTARWRRAS